MSKVSHTVSLRRVPAPPDLTCRPMQFEDLKQILEIENASFPTPWTRTMFLGEMNNSRSILRVVSTRQRMIGYLALIRVLDEIHLTSIAIHPDFRRLGIGTSLLLAVLAEMEREGAKILYLEVREGNTHAISFYRNLNMALAGVRPGYYQDTGENALLLWGDIPAIISTYSPEIYGKPGDGV